ncbi:MAG TPA: hypothetical protein VGQ83_03255 [Polyangia bacterium]|jgi:hypothetical protein
MRASALTVVLVLLGCGGQYPPPAAPPAAGPPPGAAPPGSAAPVVAAPADDLSQPLPCPVDPSTLGYGHVTWPAGSEAQRWGHGVTQVAAARTSKARPIEVCQVRGQLQWLMRLSCPDGTRPYPDPRTAHRSRAGNVGPGGRCGRIVDRYVVPCPDRTYEVFMDLYHCTPDGQ